MNFLELVNKQIPIDDVISVVSSPQCGAISLFMGTTRDNFEGLEVRLTSIASHHENLVIPSMVQHVNGNLITPLV